MTFFIAMMIIDSTAQIILLGDTVSKYASILHIHFHLAVGKVELDLKPDGILEC